MLQYLKIGQWLPELLAGLEILDGRLGERLHRTADMGAQRRHAVVQGQGQQRMRLGTACDELARLEPNALERQGRGACAVKGRVIGDRESRRVAGNKHQRHLAVEQRRDDDGLRRLRMPDKDLAAIEPQAAVDGLRVGAQRTRRVALALLLPCQRQHRVALGVQCKPLGLERVVLAVGQQGDGHHGAGDDRLADKPAAEFVMHREHRGRRFAEPAECLWHHQAGYAQARKVAPATLVHDTRALALAALRERPVVGNHAAQAVGEHALFF